MPSSYESLLRSFAEAAGLDAENLVSTEEIAIDGLPIGLQLNPGEDNTCDVRFFAELGIVRDADFPQVARRILEANYFWSGTGGATLGLEPDSNTVALCGRAPLAALTDDGLALLLARFTDIAATWKAYLASSSIRETSSGCPAARTAIMSRA